MQTSVKNLGDTIKTLISSSTANIDSQQISLLNDTLEEAKSELVEIKKLKEDLISALRNLASPSPSSSPSLTANLLNKIDASAAKEEMIKKRNELLERAKAREEKWKLEEEESIRKKIEYEKSLE